MQLILITILVNLLACFVFVNGQTATFQGRSDRTLAGLNGPVRSTLVETTSPSGIVREEMMTYDIDGRMTERWNYDSKGTLSNRKVFKYDQKNILQEEVEYYGSDEVCIKTRHSYELTGKRTASVEIGTDGTESAKTSYTFDSAGNLIEKRSKNSLFFGESVEIYSYSANGELTGKKANLGYSQSRTEYKYESGKLTSEFSRDVLQETAINYDSHGNITQKTSKFGRTYTSEKYSYNYDDKENWIKQTVNIEVYTVPDDVGIRRDDTGAIRLYSPEKVYSSRQRQRTITYF